MRDDDEDDEYGEQNGRKRTKERKAIVPKNSIYNVSKDKMLFISRLIYTVGYDGKRYNESHDNEGNPNRMLSNLLRRYIKEDFPMLTAGHYML